MSLFHVRRNIPVETGLHPAVYAALTGCLVWIMAAPWVAFGADGYLALQLAIMTFLAFMFAFVPFWLAMVGRAANKPAKARPFQEWAHHEFTTASGPVEAKDAAIMVLLAPASVALGITLTSLIAWLAGHGLLGAAIAG